MVKKLAMIAAGLLLSMGLALAQTKISGTVVSSEDGEPIIGATVLVIGTGEGAATDIDGRFELTLPEGKTKLRVSSVGMLTQELTARPNMKITLQPDAKMLDEVMVVAYGTSKKSSFTGSAQAVSGEKLELRPITSVTKGLEGEASGILVTSGSGQPGSDPAIRIRGFGSINASSAPLYVVDGIPYDGALSSINPADIESMTLLKDASSAALYGNRAANGVVIITTKKGKLGKVNVNWRSTVGWSSRALKKYDNVNQQEFVQLVYEGLRNGYIYDNGLSWAEAEAKARVNLGKELGGERYNPFKNYTWDQIIDPATGQIRPDARSAWNENWMDAVERGSAMRHEHQLSLNGGNEKNTYMMSLGYMNEDGTLKTTRFQRYNARLNLESQVTDWFKTSLNTSLAHSISNFSDYKDASTSNVWYTAQFINPLFPVYLKDMDGNSIYKDGQIEYDWGELGRIGSMADFNSLGSLLLDKAETKRDIAGLRASVQFGSDNESFGVFKGLKFAMNFGLDYDNANYMSYMNNKHGNQAKAGGRLEKGNTRTQSYTFNQLLTYNRSFDAHNLDVLFGHEYYDFMYNYLGAAKNNLVEGILELRPGTTAVLTDSYSDRYRIDSWLGRLNYNYNDTYYLSASIRTDKSSRFHRDYRKGTFWSLGANWRITNEKFMKDIKWIDNMNYKISYGEQGNDNILDAYGYSVYYLWQSLYDLNFANANGVGGLLSTLENKDISWEKNGNFNTGIDASLFNRRLKFNIEYYYKTTRDMLLSVPMASSLGFDSYLANRGNMRNTGFEMEISGAPIQTNDFTWRINWMGSTIHNKVTKLTAETPKIIRSNFITREGAEINTFYMPKSAGVDPTTGKQLYWAYEKDDNGNITKEYVTDDGSVANNSRYELGSRIPDLYGSIGTSLSYKGFDLSVLTTYSIGGKVFDELYSSSMGLSYLSSTWNRHMLRRWQKPGDITDVPAVTIGNMDYATDRYLINASYFAIKNITLSYNLPASILAKARLNHVRVFCSFDNVALFSHLDGMDPQYNFSGSTDYSYSPNKTLQFGLEVNF